MAPSIAELPERTGAAAITGPVKDIPRAAAAKTKVRRVIDEEGGKTTASVRKTTKHLFSQYVRI